MMRDDRERLDLSVARASRLLGGSVRRDRDLEDGEAYPDLGIWDRIGKLRGRPQTMDARATHVSAEIEPPT